MNAEPHKTSFEKMLDTLDRGERAFLAGHRDGWYERDLDEHAEDADRYWDGYGHGTRNGRRRRGEPATLAVLQVTIAVRRPGGEIVLFGDELAHEIYPHCDEGTALECSE